MAGSFSATPPQWNLSDFHEILLYWYCFHIPLHVQTTFSMSILPVTSTRPSV